jgi:hypothetical protein
MAGASATFGGESQILASHFFDLCFWMHKLISATDNIRTENCIVEKAADDQTPISKHRLPAHPNSKLIVKRPTCSARSKSFCVQDTRVSRSCPHKKSSVVFFSADFHILINLTVK